MLPHLSAPLERSSVGHLQMSKDLVEAKKEADSCRSAMAKMGADLQVAKKYKKDLEELPDKHESEKRKSARLVSQLKVAKKEAEVARAAVKTTK